MVMAGSGPRYSTIATGSIGWPIAKALLGILRLSRTVPSSVWSETGPIGVEEVGAAGLPEAADATAAADDEAATDVAGPTPDGRTARPRITAARAMTPVAIPTPANDLAAGLCGGR